MEVWRGAYVVTGGRYSDITYAYDYQRYVVFDYARDQFDKFPYSLVENWKNGRVFSTKYGSCVKRVAECRLIVFTNFMPDRSKLSKDRWDIWFIKADKSAEQRPAVPPVQIVI